MSTTPLTAAANHRRQTILQSAILIGIIIAANILAGALLRVRLDLTADKRFTLHPSSRNILRSLPDDVQIEVYLSGEFPAIFKRLGNATNDLLSEFRGINSRIAYRFINPLAGDAQQVAAMRDVLKEEGIVPVFLETGSSTEKKQQLIYPYAKIYYNNQKAVVNLLENQVAGRSRDEIINASIGLLEYKFINALQGFLRQRRPFVGIVQGHGELAPPFAMPMLQTLRPYYNVGFFELPYLLRTDTTGRLLIDSAKVDLLIIQRPTQPFGDREKFLLDQYIMRGGKVMWLLDRLNVETDSLRRQPVYVPFDYPQDYEDMLFRYGARVNPDIVLSNRCAPVPVVVGMMGDKAQTELRKWFYEPIVFNENDSATAVATGKPQIDHPIVKNTDGVWTHYPSTIDTIKTKSYVKKTYLLRSSRYSRVQVAPVRISLEYAGIEERPEAFNKPHRPVALLLEGTFNSAFDNRVSPEMLASLDSVGLRYMPTSVPTRQIVIADGNIFNGYTNPRNKNQPIIGYNRYLDYTFGNRDLLLNSVEYLLDQKGVIGIRSKEVKMRVLDHIKVDTERGYWQVFNIALPLVLLVGFGVSYALLRRRRYTT